MAKDVRPPSLVDALIPALVLVLLLACSVFLFGDASSSGANQIALLVASAVAIIVGIKNGLSWETIEKGIIEGVSVSLRAIMILFAVGTLIGSWILSGTVPTMIYYGLRLLDPSIFYAACCVISAFVALSIGSSWTVAGTIGIGLIGTAAALGLPLEITAGAIISGAYFGDKMSPLSDTTNLAPAVAGTDLFTHIKHMAWTTGPSIIISLIIFTIIGLFYTPSGTANTMAETLDLLDQQFYINVILLLPLVLVLALAMKQFPALPTILGGTLIGCIFALVFQPDVIYQLAGNTDIPLALALFKGVWMVLFDGYVANTGHAAIDDLLTRGGMSSMLNTVWLVLMAMIFGAVLDKVGLLARLVQGILSSVKSTGSLIAVTIASCMGANIITADQYISIVLPGRMYRLEFERRGLAPQNLSRVLEDSATITSPLIPWNTCGAFMAGTLGVATFAYLPYCFFNLINPVISLIYGFTGFKLTPLQPAVKTEGGSKELDSQDVELTAAN
ncbi:Na+/H+ antiporter NhaC [Dasania sp. GY-MA-18]|uniref:Na+/H+ antiporter NhaC n=1 Tax=Dasania phycosphaerae TaxID=2950436 RepID=A0A9J6RNS7_9GAMM|nr:MULTISPECIES: Na+/H+ antiporter NhaC [Dasania]MCR8923535.1 Na+/H+ antiporter NhaC [Dasania sp. GY-MA-18]MCZ0865969.1 Na+/H+ antiporter NhaC [Dasania phycosphaerae]MCZ0869693.1 Na+/H+ antiporter NhaC [Dasania phycosphaerae]